MDTGAVLAVKTSHEYIPMDKWCANLTNLAWSTSFELCAEHDKQGMADESDLMQTYNRTSVFIQLKFR